MHAGPALPSRVFPVNPNARARADGGAATVMTVGKGMLIKPADAWGT
jgi:hypothetical protein